MDFLEYINSYDNCAINHVEDISKLEYLVEKYPQVFVGDEFNVYFRKGLDKSMRFEYGKFISYLTASIYRVGDFFGCEAVIDFADITIEDENSDDALDISTLI